MCSVFRWKSVVQKPKYRQKPEATTIIWRTYSYLRFQIVHSHFSVTAKEGSSCGKYIFATEGGNILPRYRASSGCRWRRRPRDVEGGCKYIKKRHRTADRSDSACWGFCEKRKAHHRREITVYQTEQRESDFEKTFVTKSTTQKRHRIWHMECEKPVEITGTVHFQSFISTNVCLLANYDACNTYRYNFIYFYVFIFQHISDRRNAAVVCDTTISALAELENEIRILLNSVSIR